MRIKWNRHLDGRSTQRQEEGTEVPEAEKKKRGTSSSPGIFKIFRRKKSRKEDEGKPDNGVPTALSTEIDEEDCASVSSVATCSSQPGSEVFTRDRSSSLFSSFRLSLPGSRRKKRRIAPTPSETVLNRQENEPQLERYSTPDLRKHSDKLDASDAAQVSLSTSSPSVRHPLQGSSSSARSLVSQKSSTLQYLDAKSAPSSKSKLSKSVSFSDCGDGLADGSLHSRRDNKAFHAVSSAAMVEEDSGALESESPVCMSDNLRMSREKKFTPAGDASSCLLNASNLRKRPSGEVVDATEMTKKLEMSSRTSETTENVPNFVSVINGFEVQCCETSKDKVPGADCLSPANVNIPNHCNGYGSEAVTDRVLVEDRNNESCAVHVNVEEPPGMQCVETRADESSAAESNTHSEMFDGNYSHSLLFSERNKPTANEKSLMYEPSNTLHCDNPTPESYFVERSENVPNFNSSNGVIKPNSHDPEIIDCIDSKKKEILAKDKHVVCHVKIYATEPVKHKSTKSVVMKNKLSEDLQLIDSSKCNNTPNVLKSETTFVPTYINKFFTGDKVLDSLLKRDSDNNDNSALNFKFNDKTICEQKVPDISSDKLKNQYDQQVPDFELSLLEFEEECNRYMSRSNSEFTIYSSIIPFYRNSRKRKSVLDRNFSSSYPNSLEKSASKIPIVKSKMTVSPRCSETVVPNSEVTNTSSHEKSCHNLMEKSTLPLLPKQWINENSIEKTSTFDEYNDGVQCTPARGKNMCQEQCLGALPTSVMLDDSDLDAIDTPHQSSTIQVFENKSGREHISIVGSEKQEKSDDRTPPRDMVSNVGIAFSALNGVMDYSYVPETPSKSSVYFDPEIRDTYRGPRAICDPLVYHTEAAIPLETLGTESYLNGHNFCDIRNLLCDDVPGDFIQGNNGLIEISNPYEEETFALPQDLIRRNFVGESFPIDSLKKCDVESVDANDIAVVSKKDSEIFESKNGSGERCYSGELPGSEILSSINNEVKNVNEVNLSELVSNSNDYSCEKRQPFTEQKNNLNKNRSSMIPCRKKLSSDTDSKRTEAKSKSNKSNNLPKFIKSESQLPSKSKSSHRMFLNSKKDSDADQIRGKLQDSSFNKLNGNNSDDSLNRCSQTTTIGNIHDLDSHTEHEEVINQSLKNIAENKGKISSIYSSYTILPSACSDCPSNVDKNGNSTSLSEDIKDFILPMNEVDDSKSVISSTSIDNIPIILGSREHGLADNITYLLKCDQNSNVETVDREITLKENGGEIFTSCPQCLNFNQQSNIPNGNTNSENYVKCSECFRHSLRSSSLPADTLRKSSLASSRESLNSQITNSSTRGKSRIPRKQPGTRGAQPSTKGPVRPPMWLSKTELTLEIQRLGNLCEARTKELNRLKMETKHVSVGFDAFAALFKYMVEDLNALSVPALTEDLGKTLKQLELTKQDLAYYEREVEEMKSHHCQELNDLSNKLFEVYQSEVAELNAKHQEEINILKCEHQKQIEHLTETFDASTEETKAHHEKIIANLGQEINNQREELQLFQEREIKDLEDKHAESSKVLQDHIEQLQKKCAELKQHSMSMEDAMRKDTDSKLQWVSSAKLDLEKEVESLKAVLEMKNKELHTLRVQNLEMEKQMEELPLAREKIKMLQARAEDLEALMVEKTKLERKLSTENQQMRDTYEKESKVNRRLSMENEELLWRLRQAENSLISGSFTEVPEIPETEENAATSPTKSPGPQMMSRSVFFTFVDKDESASHSPRSQYKKIMPGFSANYKTSPAKTSKSPPAPSPRRAKSHSEPPQPQMVTSTPNRKAAKQALSKTKGAHKRHRSGSESGNPKELSEVAPFSSVTESMASSVSSESSVFEHQERLLEEHKEHIIHSLEILREQRSTEGSADDPPLLGKKWCSDDIKITGELSHLETEDMSRSAEFADPKTYYHMTFPVLKESGMPDCDIDDGKNSSSNGSPVKERASTTMHSMSGNSSGSAVETRESLQITNVSTHTIVSTSSRVENKRNSCTEAIISTEEVQEKTADSEKIGNRWRTI